jgi:signal transduction histidine kinase
MKNATRKQLTLIALGTAAALTCASALAAPVERRATKEEAVAMVKKGVQYIKASGKEKAYADFTAKGGKFHDRDLYLVVYGLDGKVWAHGQNERMVGKVVIDLKDIDGKEFVRERVELGKSKPSFWQDYKFTDPLTKKIEAKQMYCERLEETVVCGGVYKD